MFNNRYQDHHNFGACFMFWLNAERSACGGNMDEGAEAEGLSEEWPDVGGRKGGGGKESGEKGN